MGIRVACGQCAKVFAVPDNLAGKRVKCPACGGAISIPGLVVEPSLSSLLDELDTPAASSGSSPLDLLGGSHGVGTQTSPLLQMPTKKGSSKSKYKDEGSFDSVFPGFSANVLYLVLVGLALLIQMFFLVRAISGGAPVGVLVFNSVLFVMGLVTASVLLAYRPGNNERFYSMYMLITFIVPALSLASLIGSAIFDSRARATWGNIFDALFSGRLTAAQVGFLVGYIGGTLLGMFVPPTLFLFLYRKFGFGRVQSVALTAVVLLFGIVQLTANSRRQQVANRPAPGPRSQHDLAPPSSPRFERPSPSFPGRPDRPRRERRSSGPWPPNGTTGGNEGRWPTTEPSSSPREEEWKISIFHAHGDKFRLREFNRAFALVDDQTLETNLKSCPAIKRPVMQVFWGFGIEYGKGATAKEGSRFGAGAIDTTSSTAFQSEFFLKAEVEKRLGHFGDSLLDGLAERMKRDQFGLWENPKDSKGQESERACVCLVPPGRPDTMLRFAKSIHADLLLAAKYDYETGADRNSPATLTMRLVDVLRGEEIWKSQSIPGENQNQSTMGELLEECFAYIDNSVQLKPFPNLAATVAQKRATTLTAKRSVDPLSALAELRYYQLKGLLSADEAKQAYEKIMNANAATQFSSDNRADRAEAIHPFLPTGW